MSVRILPNPNQKPTTSAAQKFPINKTLQKEMGAAMPSLKLAPLVIKREIRAGLAAVKAREATSIACELMGAVEWLAKILLIRP